MDELKSRFESAMESVVPPPGDLRETKRSGQTRARVRLIGIVAGVLSIAVFSGLGTTLLLGSRQPIQTAGGNQGYLFTFDVLDYDSTQNHARVSYTSRWEGNDYPGTRQCTWNLYRDDGSFISDWEYYVSLQLQETVRKTTDVTTPELPAHIAAECGPRLDRGNYEVSSEPIVERRQLGSEAEWVLAFSLRWNGSDARGAAECRWKLLSQEDGAVVMEDTVSVGGGEGANLPEVVVRLLRDFKSDPGEAEVFCRTL